MNEITTGHIAADGRAIRTMKQDTPFDAVASARQVLRVAATGGLATLATDGAPFSSLVTVATAPNGSPLLLISDLAVHTKNIKRDARASLLLVAPGGEGGDPLAGARLSVVGTVARDEDANNHRRFLAQHPEAAGYARFKDFGFYRMTVTGAHLVAGFGRIVDLTAAELLTDVSDCAGLIEAEAGAVEHMNDDHADALALYATRLLGLPEGDWRTTGTDPDGLDLRAGSLRGRLPFPQKARTGGDLRDILVHLVKEARAKA